MHDTSPPLDPGLPCTSFRALVGDIAADAVDAVTAARVEAHAASCEGCRFALAAARAYQRAMRRIGSAVRASDSLRERVLGMRREVRGSDRT